jgi:hypothetical protein
MSIVRVNFKSEGISRRHNLSGGAIRCRRKFLRFFPKGFQDPKYDAWERGYKWEAHQAWQEVLSESIFSSLLRKRNFSEIATRAVRIESRTNLLFSFEKMALRDAVKTSKGAELFATELFQFLYGKRASATAFQRWVETVTKLPRKQTRVLTWPLVTVFGFIARPETHIFLKPNVTRAAAAEYEFEFQYFSKPSWETYSRLLEFARVVRADLADLQPRDQIDAQSFFWVLGSNEYFVRSQSKNLI